MMPVNTAAARMTSSGMRRVMGGAIALPMVQPMHIMMANGQLDGTTDDEHDCGEDIRAEADHGFQRVDLMERADFAQIENR